jgi:hypothetical protein
MKDFADSAAEAFAVFDFASSLLYRLSWAQNVFGECGDSTRTMVVYVQPVLWQQEGFKTMINIVNVFDVAECISYGTCLI